jgi:putative PIN family toxin of toxin-antitoxin system
MRAVFETNLLVSYLLTHRPSVATLVDRHLAEERFVLLTAPELLQELDPVLHCPKLARYYTEEQRMRFVALVRALAEVVELPAMRAMTRWLPAPWLAGPASSAQAMPARWPWSAWAKSTSRRRPGSWSGWRRAEATVSSNETAPAV